jgi:hypothetical protein
MVIDDYNIWMYRTDTVKQLARQVIDQLSPRASMALLFTSRTGSTEVTQDRAELLAAADRMKGRQQVRRRSLTKSDLPSSHPAPIASPSFSTERTSGEK